MNCTYKKTERQNGTGSAACRSFVLPRNMQGSQDCPSRGGPDIPKILLRHNLRVGNKFSGLTPPCYI